MDHVIRTAATYGIDIPLLFFFGLAWYLSGPTNHVVKVLMEHQFYSLPDAEGTVLVDGRPRFIYVWRERFDMAGASIIGIWERRIFIAAIVLGQFSIIEAWLILKAFYSWLEKDSGKPTLSIKLYHRYIFGNALSLLDGLLLGEGACFMARLIWHLVNSARN